MRPSLFLAAAAVVLAGLPAPTPADPPPADPYAITAEAGTWAICAGSFEGEESYALAHQMVEILRNHHQLPAYLFDRGDAERRKDWEEHLQMEQRYNLPEGVHLPFRHPRYKLSCAVLIGGFQDVEAANAALAKVKQLPRPELKLSNGQPAFDTFFGISPDKEKKWTIVNPFANSFVTRNPTAPAPKVEAAKVDPIWKELNAPESYSLLKNPKSWTLVVKEFRGSHVIKNQTDSGSLVDWLTKMGHKPGEGINAAGNQAHQLAEFLRDKRIGFDAYVLHMRTSSVVTVGSFDSLDDPELQKTKNRLERLSFRADTRSASAAGIKGDPIKGDPIGLLPHPVPMEVPHF